MRLSGLSALPRLAIEPSTNANCFASSKSTPPASEDDSNQLLTISRETHGRGSRDAHRAGFGTRSWPFAHCFSCSGPSHSGAALRSPLGHRLKVRPGRPPAPPPRRANTRGTVWGKILTGPDRTEFRDSRANRSKTPTCNKKRSLLSCAPIQLRGGWSTTKSRLPRRQRSPENWSSATDAVVPKARSA